MKNPRRLLINILVILILVFLYYYFMFIPTQTILNKKTDDKYISDMKIEATVFDNTISKYIQGTKSISSRSMIRNKITDFYAGKISYEELKTYTKPKYLDGVKALDNVIFAGRYVNNKMLVQAGNIDLTNVDFVVKDTAKQKFKTGFLINDTISYTYVLSPIIGNKSILGYDIIYFNNDIILQKIADKNIDFKIFYNFQNNYISYNGEKLFHKTDNCLLHQNNKTSYQIKSKESDAFFIFTVSKDILYRDLRVFYRIQIIIFILLITGTILFLFVIQQREKLIYLKKNEYLKELITKKNIKLTKLIDELNVKQTEILENEERYRNVADFTYDWEYWIDKNQNFIYISPSCERITGYSPEEFSQNRKLFFNIIHPDDIDILKNHIHKINKKGEIQPIDFRIIKKNNEIRWISHICQNVYDKNGKNIGKRGSNRDITNRKKAEQAIIESEKSLNQLIENTSDGISIMKEDKFIFVNTPFSKILDYSVKELQNLSLKDILSEESFISLKKEIAHFIDSDREFFKSEVVMVKKDKSLIDAKIIIKNIKYKGEFAHLFQIRDISKQKEIMKLLQKGAEQTKGLNEFIPICAGCNLIRDDEKEDKPWVKPADYFSERLPDIKFSHTMCPDCMKKWYPDFVEEKET